MQDMAFVCPVCQADEGDKELSEVPISYGVLQALQVLAENSFSDRMSAKRDSSISLLSSQGTISYEPQLHAGMCSDHGCYKVFFCKRCDIWVCRDCTIIDHVQPCEIISIKKELANMKENGKRDFLSEIELCKSKLADFEELYTDLKSTGETFQRHISLMEEIGKKYKDLLDSLQEDIKKCPDKQTMINNTKKYYEDSLQKFEEAETVEEVMELLASLKDMKDRNQDLADHLDFPILHTCKKACVTMDAALVSLQHLTNPEEADSPLTTETSNTSVGLPVLKGPRRNIPAK